MEENNLDEQNEQNDPNEQNDSNKQNNLNEQVEQQMQPDWWKWIVRIDTRSIILHIVLVSIVVVTLFISKPLLYLLFSKSSPNLIEHYTDDTPVHRLPKSVVPIHYQIELVLASKANYHGETNITINIVQKTKQISFHSINLCITSNMIALSNNNGVSCETEGLDCYADKQWNTINFANTLLPGRYTLYIKFNGIITDDITDGFARIPYTENTQKGQNWFYVANSRIKGARRIFPCWDEPEFKATFELNIKHPKNCIASSNMPLISSHADTEDGGVWTYFNLTQEVPTYLIIFTIHKNDFVRTSIDNVDILYKKHTNEEHLQFAEQVITFVGYVLRNFEWQISQEANIPNPNLQHPEQKRTMEDLKIILYRAEHILYDEKSDPSARKADIVRFIAHEMIYVWLSNKVTPSWWSYLWINEGLSMVIQMDALYKIPSEINEITGKNGLPTPNDFWTAIRYVDPDGTNLKHLMDSWTNKISYPILEVTRDYTTGVITVRLNRQALTTWSIRVSFTSESVCNFHDIDGQSTWMTFYYVLSSRLYDIHPDDWVILNLQQTGYYRVYYDKRNWRRLARFLKTEKYDKIHVLNRAQIIDDAYYFMVRKMLEHDEFADIIEYLALRETNYIAWYPMIKNFELMSRTFPYQQSTYIKQHVLRSLVDGLLQKIGFQEISHEDDLTKRLRQEARHWACVLNSTMCTEAATVELRHYMLDEPSAYKFWSGWREWTHCKGLMSGDADTWNKLFVIWASKRDNQTLEYLACTENLEIIYKYLRPLSSDHAYAIMQHHHAKSFLSVVARHAKNIAILKFILRNFRKIKPKEVSTVAALLVIINNVYSAEQLQMI
ncbi:Aminopeptidase N [Ooceraea biroi]|uniref:Aminopeptidase N n=1 Tax=Ooceraea biroi TaxID=2015173 RepID=A0A026VXA2_OOCBI|nr:Aminopeptidase N [Ooceraea biroi]